MDSQVRRLVVFIAGVAIATSTSIAGLGTGDQRAMAQGASDDGTCGPASPALTTADGVIQSLPASVGGTDIRWYSAPDDVEIGWLEWGAIRAGTEPGLFEVWGVAPRDVPFIVKADRFPGACGEPLLYATLDSAWADTSSDDIVPYAGRTLGTVHAVRVPGNASDPELNVAVVGDLALTVQGSSADVASWFRSLTVPEADAQTPPPSAPRSAAAPGEPGWRRLDDMPLPRQGVLLTLDDDSVLQIGGLDDLGPVSDVQQLDPGSGSWTAMPALRAARDDAAAVQLRDGRVLVAGGTSDDGALSSVEIFDPRKNVWQRAAYMNEGRSDFTLSRLGDGRVVAIGGIGYDGSTLSSIEVYDPFTDYWEAYGGLSYPRAHHLAALLDDGRVLVAGGNDGQGNVVWAVESFDADEGYASLLSDEAPSAWDGGSFSTIPVNFGWYDPYGLYWFGCAYGQAADAFRWDPDSYLWRPAPGAPCTEAEVATDGSQALFLGRDPWGLGGCVFSPETEECAFVDPTFTRHDGGSLVSLGNGAFVLAGGWVEGDDGSTYGGATEVLQLPE